MDPELEKFSSLDSALVDAARTVKVLSNLAWPPEVGDRFLSAWRKNAPILPRYDYPRLDFSENKQALLEIRKRCELQHPIGNYLAKTASSFVLAAEMLEQRTTPEFTKLSARLYGLPLDPLGSGQLTLLDAAEDFIRTTEDFKIMGMANDQDLCILATTVASELQVELDSFFQHHKVEVVIDEKLTSKAAAGARRVRLRGSTCFAPIDIPQLTQHECFVHSLTLLNGREQPYLKSMGLGAPRTTLTQEGLAMFAELVNSCMDINRLRRIALRVKAVYLALEGADFIEIFKFFLESGQSEYESFQSAARIFRGGAMQGRYVFTKDVTYLSGLLFVHTFLRKAIQAGKLLFPHYLFSGRLTLSDVICLEPYFQSGYITRPLYEPKWIMNRAVLSSFLLYSAFINEIDLSKVGLEDFVDLDIQ